MDLLLGVRGSILCPTYLDDLLELPDLLLSEVQLFLEPCHLPAFDLELLTGALLQDQDSMVQLLESNEWVLKWPPADS